MLGRMRAEPGRDHNRTHTGLEGHLLAQIKELSKQLDQERGLSPADLEWEEPTQQYIPRANATDWAELDKARPPGSSPRQHMKCDVRDLYAGKDLAPATFRLSAEVGEHDIAVLRLSNCK